MIRAVGGEGMQPMVREHLQLIQGHEHTIDSFQRWVFAFTGPSEQAPMQEDLGEAKVIQAPREGQHDPTV